MRTKIAMTLAVGMLLAWSAREAQAANLVHNPGFENGLNDWTDRFGAPSKVSTTTFHSGAMSATKSVATVSGQEYWSQISQDIAVSAGNPIYASVYLKSTFSPAATAKGGLMVQFYNTSGKLIGTSVTAPQIGGTVNWRLIELSTTAPANAVKVRLSAFIYAAQNDNASLSGALFIDDAFLDKIVKSPAPQTTLRNRGFENGLNDWNDLFGFPSFLSTSPKRTGVYAAGKRVETVNGQDYWSQIHQEVAITPTQTGIATVYVQTDFATNSAARAGLIVEFLNANGAVISDKTSAVVGGQTPWRQVSVSWTSSPAGTKKVRVSGFIFAPQGDVPSIGGRAFYDDATLTIQ